MNLTFTLAIGDKSWGEKALNWCLSVKAAYPQAKTALIYQPSAIAGIEHYIEAFFDYTLQVQDSVITNPAEYAFKLKTELYDLATSIADAEAYLFMDADTIMLSGRSVDEFFNELKDVDFTMWCNDVYDFATKTRMRDDYTFWCEPEEIIAQFGDDTTGCKLPQVNSSFIYFKQKGSAESIFGLAKDVWEGKHKPLGRTISHKKYRGSMPDEFCFNIALMESGDLPHQIPYYPIFFSFSSEHFEEQYIRSWKAIGFAGDTKQQDGVVHLYNHNVAYFRKEFGVEEKFEVGLSKDKQPKDRHPLAIEPISKRTIYRRDEVINSGGGIFNPDGIYIDGFGYVTIFRKEKNMDFYKVGHNQATAIPHVHILTKDTDESFELEVVDAPENVRLEDFRIVSHNGAGLWVSHTVIEKNLTKQMTARIGVSYVDFFARTLEVDEIINLPVEPSKIEKNWVFFVEDGCWYCIYSLSPYRLFAKGESEWSEVSVFQPEIDWFHKGQRICNSTRPVLIGNEYLMLFHSREAGIYFQGAVIIDKATKDITHYTKRSIPIKTWGEGFQPNLIYISGLLYQQEKNLLRVFFGESDSHSCSHDYNADEFVALVKQNSVYESNNESVLELLKQTT
jgi:hypothetical protein